MQIRSVGIDLGKTTFHLVALGSSGKEPLPSMRATFIEWFDITIPAMAGTPVWANWSWSVSYEVGT